jgi:hypothetical protein
MARARKVRKTMTLASGKEIETTGRFVRGRRGIQNRRPLELEPSLMKKVKK